MSVLRRRLGEAVVSALKGGDTLIESILAGSGADLNVDLASEDDVDSDTTLIAQCRVEMMTVERVPFPSGENRGSKRRVYPFRIIFKLQSDVAASYPGMDVWQALDRIFGDPRTFFRDYVTDTENNLSAHAGRLELDEDFIQPKRGSETRLEFVLRITVGQVGALTE